MEPTPRYGAAAGASVGFTVADQLLFKDQDALRAVTAYQQRHALGERSLIWFVTVADHSAAIEGEGERTYVLEA